jgi:hypothetical protein
VIILDAYAVIAFLLGEPAAPEVAGLIQGDQAVAVTPLGLAEAVDRLVRGAGADPDEAVLDLAELGLTDPPPWNRWSLAPACCVPIHHPVRGVAGGCVVETARSTASVATSDPHLLDVCTTKAPVIVLPDTSASAGNRGDLKAYGSFSTGPDFAPAAAAQVRGQRWSTAKRTSRASTRRMSAEGAAVDHDRHGDGEPTRPSAARGIDAVLVRRIIATMAITATAGAQIC